MSVDWSTANPDWEADITAGRSLVPFAPLFPNEAKAGIDVLQGLRIVDAMGSPTIGESCAPWVTDMASALFGSYNADTGRREIREYFVCVPKKNSKSTIAAAIMLTVLIRNWRNSAEFIILAPTVEVADNSFKPARDMVMADPELENLLLVQTHTRTITHRLTGATLKVVAAASNTVGGKKAVGVLIDELHLFGNQAQAENMMREATGGLMSRPEGFTLMLTTMADAPPAGIFKQKLQYARDVRDGRVIDKRFLPIIYEYPEAILKAGEHKNPANFHIVNPNMGYSVDRETLEREYLKAENAGDESMLGFMSKHLNVEIGMKMLSNNWAGAAFWQAQKYPDGKLTLEKLLELSDVVTIGIDGGGLDDLLGLCVMGRHADTGKWLIWTRAWVHPIGIERRKSEREKYMDFKKDGDLRIVDKMGDDVKEVADIVEQCEKSDLLDMIGVDAAGIGAIVEEIVGRGIEYERVISIPQGWRLMGAIKTLERKLAEGSALHMGSELMAWAVSNAKVEIRTNAILITKQSSGTAKIDPLLATFNASALMTQNPQGRRKKYQMVFV